MKIAVFGATGKTGRCLIEQALDAGHEVKALVRSAPDDPLDSRVEVAVGDARDPEPVAEVVAGADAVACILGLAKPEGTVVSDGTRVICEQMREAGVDRLVAVTSMGLGETKDDSGAIGRLFVRLFMSAALEDRARQEDVIRDSGLRYTVVRPIRLVDGPRTGSYEAAPRVRAGMAAKIRRADVADLTLRQLAERPEPGAVSIVGR